MTPTLLHALRKLMFFSPGEAAALIAADRENPQGVGEAQWLQWESGAAAIPEEIVESVRTLLSWRAKMIWTSVAMLETAMAVTYKQQKDIALTWYETLEDWRTLPEHRDSHWRPYCSAAAELAARYGVKLVPFNQPAYLAWLGERKDTEALRADWAGHDA